VIHDVIVSKKSSKIEVFDEHEISTIASILDDLGTILHYTTVVAGA
jgi:hypothetical protein